MSFHCLVCVGVFLIREGLASLDDVWVSFLGLASCHERQLDALDFAALEDALAVRFGESEERLCLDHADHSVVHAQAD